MKSSITYSAFVLLYCAAAASWAASGTDEPSAGGIDLPRLVAGGPYVPPAGATPAAPATPVTTPR